MASKAFEKADRLSTLNPLPEDVMEQLQELEKQIEPYEARDFGWIYEAVELILSDTSEGN